MASVSLLEKLEDYLENDLRRERLSNQNSIKRKLLVAKIREEIAEIKNTEKLGKLTIYF